MPYKSKASKAKRKKLVAWVDEQLKETDKNDLAKKLGVNPGNLNWVYQERGFSQEVWDASGLEDPPPRERFCCEDPGKVVTNLIDEACEFYDMDRTNLIKTVVRFWMLTQKTAKLRYRRNNE